MQIKWVNLILLCSGSSWGREVARARLPCGGHILETTTHCLSLRDSPRTWISAEFLSYALSWRTSHWRHSCLEKSCGGGGTERERQTGLYKLRDTSQRRHSWWLQQVNRAVGSVQPQDPKFQVSACAFHYVTMIIVLVVLRSTQGLRQKPSSTNKGRDIRNKSV